MTFRTRFAPSPTGPLHLGHAYSALLAHRVAHRAGGQFLLRIEDIDRTRARAEWEEQIYDDLRWLGITWDEPPMRQSDRLPAYQATLDELWQRGLLYPCTCNRRDIQQALSAPQEGAEPVYGPDGPVYPGTCRPASPDSASPRPEGNLRLNMARTIQGLPDSMSFEESGRGTNSEHGEIAVWPQSAIRTIGDIVLNRRDYPASYHLAVVLDDAAQGITHVFRGSDLFDATRIHVILQHRLGLPTPRYHHHQLIRDDNGKRLAKRDDARAIAKYREDGATPQDIHAILGLTSAL